MWQILRPRERRHNLYRISINKEFHVKTSEQQEQRHHWSSNFEASKQREKKFNVDFILISINIYF